MVSRWLRGGDTSGRAPFKSPGSNSQRVPHTRSPTHPPRMSRDMVARGHLAPRPATQEATCNGARASSRAFQQTMGRVCSDVMVKHQPVRETLALISATKRRYRRRMSRFAHVSHPRPRYPGGTPGLSKFTRGRPAGPAPTTEKNIDSAANRDEVPTCGILPEDAGGAGIFASG